MAAPGVASSRAGPGRPPPLSQARLEALLEAMHAAADAARAITVPRFRAPLAVDDKAHGGDAFDPVTSADRDAEAVIRAHLAALHPDIGFVGEESAPSSRADDGTGRGDGVAAAGLDGGDGAAARWVVDPIDGTRAYITGMPLWGTLIALHDGHDVVLGLLDQPILGERYVGRAGGAVLHAHGSVRPLGARGGRTLAEAALCCTTPDMFVAADERAAFERVRARARLVRFGGDCYAYAQLAAGHVDVVVECDLKPWDVQALIPLVRGAGGVISDWRGASAAAGGRIVACGSAALHEEVLALLDGGRGSPAAA